MKLELVLASYQRAKWPLVLAAYDKYMDDWKHILQHK